MKGPRQRGVLDHNYLAYFPIYQKPTIQHLIRYVNFTHDVSPIENLMQIFETGQGALYYRGYKIQPRTVYKEEDILTLPGLTECINQMRGTVNPWRFMGVGNTSDAAFATVNDAALASEISSRVDMSDVNLGWRETAGMKLLFGAI